MNNFTNTITNFQFENSGLVIKPADPQKRLWIISNIVIHKEVAHKESGLLVIVACDRTGAPANDAEFIVGWKDAITYPVQHYAGRFSLNLDRIYNPRFERGPYWVGPLVEGTGDEIHGLGIPVGYSYQAKIIYTFI